MESGIFWDVFESTGSIEAYLTYSKAEHYFSETYNIGGVSVDESEKTRTVKRKKTKSDSEYS
jgi:hypothetical protein